MSTNLINNSHKSIYRSRRVLLASICCILFAQPSLAQTEGVKTPKSDKEREHLLGPVRSLSLDSAKIICDGGKCSEGPREHVATVYYDKHGNWVKRIDRGQQDQWSYVYNREGRVIEKAVLAEDGSKISRSDFIYASDEHLVEEKTCDLSTSICTRASYTYDEAARLLARTTYNPDGTIHLKRECSYDDKGNVTCQTRHGIGLSEDIQLYNAKRDLLEDVTYGIDGNLVTKWVYHYNAKGTLVGAVGYKEGGAFVDRQVYAYDDRGNRTEVAFYNEDGSLRNKWIFSYEYDSVGNWVKKIEFHNSRTEPREITYRTITYYPEAKK